MWFRLYAYGFLSSLYLDQFLWFVYLLRLGYSPAQIGVAYAGMQALRFAGDIPSSVLGDRLGQRPVLILGSLLKALSSLLFLFAGRGFAFVLFGCAVTALALTLPSGVDLSYVRDLAHSAVGNEAASQHRLARYMSMRALASLGAGLLGGLIASLSFARLYETDVALSLFAAIVATTLPNLRPEGRISAGTTWRQSLLSPVREVLRAPRAFWSVGILVIPLFTLSSVATEYSQALLQQIGMQPFWISLTFAAAGGAAWLGSLLSGRVPEVRRERYLRLIVWLYPLSALLRSFAAPSLRLATAAGTVGVGIARFGSGVAGVLADATLLDHAPANYRATALSAVNTVQMAAMMLLFPAMGVVAAKTGAASVFLWLAGGLLAVAVAMQAVLAPRRRAREE